MKQCITSLLGLKEDDVEYITSEEKNGITYIRFTLTNHGGRCPKCGAFSKKVHAYRNTKVNHAIFAGKECQIIFRCRRFKCSNPDCDSTFCESNPFTSQYANTSDATVELVCELLKQYNETFSSVAKKTFLSVSQVQRIFDEHVQMERKVLPEVIAIDEFYFSRKRKKKYAFMILDVKDNSIVDILSSRLKSDLRNYFKKIPIKERQNVKYISIDMYAQYKDVVQEFFPWATLCVDPFHAVKLVGDALNHIRLRKMHEAEFTCNEEARYLLKFQHRLLTLDPYKIEHNHTKFNRFYRSKMTQYDLQERLLNTYPEIKTAYFLYQRFTVFEDPRHQISTKEEQLESFIKDCLDSEITELIGVGLSINNWKDEILNSFSTFKFKYKRDGKVMYKIRRVTSGSIEGKNKFIKIIIKLANGYSNFARFRNRAMYCLNKDATYSKTRLKNKVKNKIKKKQK